MSSVIIFDYKNRGERGIDHGKKGGRFSVSLLPPHPNPLPRGERGLELREEDRGCSFDRFQNKID